MALADGGTALIAAALLLAWQELGVLASALAGLTLLGFEVIEVTSIDRRTGNLFPIVIALACRCSLGQSRCGDGRAELRPLSACIVER